MILYHNYSLNSKLLFFSGKDCTRFIFAFHTEYCAEMHLIDVLFAVSLEHIFNTINLLTTILDKICLCKTVPTVF